MSCCLIVSAWRSWRVSHHHMPAFLLNDMVLIVIGMGLLLLNDAYGWSSAVLMLIASLFFLSGIFLICRYLPRAEQGGVDPLERVWYKREAKKNPPA